MYLVIYTCILTGEQFNDKLYRHKSNADQRARILTDRFNHCYYVRVEKMVIEDIDMSE